MSMYDEERDLENQLRELRARRGIHQEPHWGYDPDPTRLPSAGQIVVGFVFGLLLPGVVAGLVAYVLDDREAALRWGLGTTIVLWVSSMFVAAGTRR